MTAIRPRETYGELGEAMRALPNEKWRDFVRYYLVGKPLRGAAEAYRKAGFQACDTLNDARNAYQLLHDQGGKSTACSFELSLHLDGCYPPWWRGLRVTEPQNYWAAGVTAASTKKNLQGLLCTRQEFGTGMIPLESFAKKPIMIPGGTGAIETAFVTWHDANGTRHLDGRASFL
jgi:hypothetical protein